MKKALIIIGYDTFRDEEYFIPKKIFEDAGYSVTTVSKQKIAKSKIEGKLVTVDKLFDELDTADEEKSDFVVFVGGPGAQIYFQDKKAHQLAWDFYHAGKLVTAICIAPVILSNASLLVGKRATVWPGAKQELCNGQCIYTPDHVVTDGRIITADGPEAAEKFAETIVKKLAEK